MINEAGQAPGLHRANRAVAGAVAALALAVAGCGSAGTSADPVKTSTVVTAAGAENEYANVLSQIGGRCRRAGRGAPGHAQASVTLCIRCRVPAWRKVTVSLRACPVPHDPVPPVLPSRRARTAPAAGPVIPRRAPSRCVQPSLRRHRRINL
jgi:hypothetical protein